MDFYAKSLPGRIKTAHAHRERCQALVADGNEHAVGTLEFATRELERLLNEASERDIPAEEIAEATAYRPVSKLREEVEALQRQVAHLGLMLDDKDAQIASYQAVHAGMGREQERSYRVLDRAKGVLGTSLMAAVLLLLWTWGAAALQALGLTGPVPFWGSVVGSIGLAFGIMLLLERMIDEGGE